MAAIARATSRILNWGFMFGLILSMIGGIRGDGPEQWRSQLAVRQAAFWSP
jgi:hypothetical protein